MILEKCREHALKHFPDELEELERRPELSEAHPELSLYEKAFVYKYTKDVMKVEAVNGALRDGHEPEFASLLKAVLQKMPPFVGQVYRGSDLSKKERERYQPGRIVHEPTFLSSSRQKRIAYQFCGNSMFSLLSWERGRSVERLSKFGSNSSQNEKEVLFLPGTRFRVLGVTKERSYTLIRLEEVNE